MSNLFARLHASPALLSIYQRFQLAAEGAGARLFGIPGRQAIVQALVPRDATTILDIGANVGTMSGLFRRLCPAAEIHAFEPEPGTYAFLEKRMRTDARVFTHNMGVADADGSLTLNRTSLSAVNSFHAPDADADWLQSIRGLEMRAPISVPVVALDSFTHTHGIERVALLKSDTQGYELQVLKGAHGLLSQARVDVLILEVMTGRFYRDASTFLDILREMDTHGYRPYSLIGHKYGRSCDLLYFDAVFIAPGMAGASS